MSSLTSLYILPVVAAVVVIIFGVPPVDSIIKGWAPVWPYNLLCQAAIIFIILFVINLFIDPDTCVRREQLKENPEEDA